MSPLAGLACVNLVYIHVVALLSEVSLHHALDGSGMPHSPSPDIGCDFDLQDFIEKTGYYAGGPGRQELTDAQRQLLDKDEGLPEVVGILECALCQWGIENTLAFVRQGGSQAPTRQAPVRNWSPGGRSFIYRRAPA